MKPEEDISSILAKIDRNLGHAEWMCKWLIVPMLAITIALTIYRVFFQ